MSLAPLYVVWPAVYGLLVAGVSRRTMLRRTLITMLAALAAIEVYTLSFLMHARGFLPAALYFPLDLGQDISSTGVEYNLYSVSSMLFLVPVVVAMLLTWPSHLELPVRRRWLWVLAGLGGVLVLLSGRRGLMLVVAASPALALAVRRWLPASERPHVPWRRWALGSVPLGLVGLWALNRIFGFEFAGVVADLRAAFEFATAEGQARGPRQLRALLMGWERHPILGSGLGGVAPGLVRSGDQPWAYELSYVALMFHTGVIGLAVYGYGVAWIYRASRRVIRAGGELAAYGAVLTVGMTAFLLANATNPYLAKFDFLWVLFAPIAVANCFFLERGKEGIVREASSR